MEKLSQFIMQHLYLWCALIGVLILIFINELLSKGKKGQDLSPRAVIDKINNENVVLIDLRDKEAFNKAHIINSIQASAEDLLQGKMNKYKDKPIILVCPRGLQSSTIAAKLRAQGYQSLVLKGGLTAWQNADLPLVKGKS